MNSRRIELAKAALDATLRAPASKSLTHRALVAAALADGSSTIRGPLVATDTRVTARALAALGVPVEMNEESWFVRGCRGVVPGGGALSLEDSGTSLRLLLAVAALSPSPSTLDGTARLRERPVEELADALRGMGAQVCSAGAAGLPLRAGGSAPRGGAVELFAGRSSQFASALLLVGSRLPEGLDLRLRPPAVSLPYIDLTVATLERFGIDVRRVGPLRWKVAPGGYAGRDLAIEGDHSTASYFLAAAAVAGGTVRVTGLDPESAQADRRLGSLLSDLGCEVQRGEDWVEVRGTGRIPAFDLVLTDAPDLVPTVAAIGLFSDGPSTVRGVAHLRHKESDRLELLARNLTALGRPSRVVSDGLVLEGPQAQLRGGTIVTGSDHRIAMAFAVAGLRLDGVTVDDADCVGKSDPGFWERLEALVTGS